MSCILDSGAVASIISSEFLEGLEKDIETKSGAHHDLVAADGGRLQVAGTVDLKLSIGELMISHPFEVVRDFAFPVLLGSDFLVRTKAVLDYKEGTVRFGRTPQDTVKLPVLGVFSEQDGTALSDLSNGASRVCVFACSCPTPALLDPGRRLSDRSSDLTSCPTTSGASHVSVSGSSSSSLTRQWKPSSHTRLSGNFSELQLTTLLDKYSHVFASGPDDLGSTTFESHRIDTGDQQPVNQPPYRMSPSNREELNHQMESMMTNGVIRPSRSAWASPVVLVDKKDGSKRFCVDYRGVNNLSKKDRYPIPRVDDSLDLLPGNQFFTTLDLLSGYWQIPVAAEDMEKTAFTTPVGLFEFTVMPFGLRNAPSSFQKAMDSVLAGLKWRTCIVYFDGVLVFSKDFDTHLHDLEAVLQRLENFKLKLNPRKCNFAQQQIHYLGYVVTPDCLHVDPQKVSAVRKLSVPQSKSVLKSFLGLTSYYRRFVKSYAQVAEPLTRLLRRTTTFEWTEPQQRAFEELKKHLMSSPLLVHPDWAKADGRFRPSHCSDFSSGR